MRVLHVAPCYPPSPGGAQVHLHRLSTDLVQHGHSVTVLTTNAHDVAYLWQPDAQKIPIDEELIDGVRVLRFPVRHLRGSPHSYHALHRLQLVLSGIERVGRGFGRFLPHTPSLQKWLSATTESFDIVGAMNLPYDGILSTAQQFARRHNIPFVCYPLTHFGAASEPGTDVESKYYTMPHQRSLVAKSDRLIAQTSFEADFYRQNGMPAEQIVVGGPGVDLPAVSGGNPARFREQFGIDRPFVLWMGRMTRSKGVVQTVEAVLRLLDAGEAIALVLLGGKSADFQSYWQQIPRSKKENLHLLGYVDEETRRDALAAAVMLSMPSSIDSFGMVYLEAWANKLPVLAAHSFGVQNLVLDNENGLLVEFGDSNMLAAAIKRLFDNPVLASRLGISGHDLVTNHHTWAHKCTLVRQTYAQLATPISDALPKRA